MMLKRHAVDGQVRASEFPHTSGVKPRQGLGPRSRLVLVGCQDDDMLPGHRTPRLEDMPPPCYGLPPTEHLGVVDADTAVVEEVRQKTNRVTEVIQVATVVDLATEDETFVRIRNPSGQNGVVDEQFIPEIPLLKTGEDIGVLRPVVMAQAQTEGDADRPVLLGVDSRRGVEHAVDDVEEERPPSWVTVVGSSPVGHWSVHRAPSRRHRRVNNTLVATEPGHNVRLLGANPRRREQIEPVLSRSRPRSRLRQRSRPDRSTRSRTPESARLWSCAGSSRSKGHGTTG